MVKRHTTLIKKIFHQLVKELTFSPRGEFRKHCKQNPHLSISLHTYCYAIIIMIKSIISSIIEVIVTIITMIKTQRDTGLPGREDRARGRDEGRPGCHSCKCLKLKIMIPFRRLRLFSSITSLYRVAVAGSV